MNANIIGKANSIVNEARTATLATIGADGYPCAATVSNDKTDGIYKMHFSSDMDGVKAQSIRQNPHVSVCYCKGSDNVTLIGEARVLTDKAIKYELWQDWFIEHFPGGENDSNYCVIEFTTQRVSLWIDGIATDGPVSDLLKIQSRCGLLCGFCAYKESANCGSCIETNGHPFHGECPVAVCCQNKGYTHCGQCPKMPCEILFAYSCKEGEHCDRPKGARLSMLRAWKKYC